MPPLTSSHRSGDAPVFVYVGTYSVRGSRGIYVYRFDTESGALTPVGATEAAMVQNPSFVALHPSRHFLYAVSEVNGGAVAAFRIDPNSGQLTPHGGKQSSGGAGPCFVMSDATGANVLVANYNNGTVAVLPLAGDGTLKPPSTTIQHTDASHVDKGRQEGPHAHSIHVDPTGRFAVACDLGCDKRFVYAFDKNRGALTPNDPPAEPTRPGAGPRQFAFHPTAPYAYGINELDSTVDASRWDAARGTLTPLQTISTLPDGFSGKNSPAELQVHPNGRWVYGSNRGHDSIAVFAVDPYSGRLQKTGIFASGGKNPRHFGISPDGRFLTAAHQDTDNLVVFQIDADRTGALTPTGITASIPAPVCVVFRG